MVCKFWVFGVVLGSSGVVFASSELSLLHPEQEKVIDLKDVRDDSSGTSSAGSPPDRGGGMELSSGSSFNAGLPVRKEQASSVDLTDGEKTLRDYFDKAKENEKVAFSFDEVNQMVQSWGATEEGVTSMNRAVDTMWPLKNEMLDDLKEAMYDGKDEEIKRIEQSLKLLYDLIFDAAKKVNDSVRSEKNLTFQNHLQMMELSRPLGEMMDEIKLYCK